MNHDTPTDAVQSMVFDAVLGWITLSDPAIVEAVNAADGGVVEVRVAFHRFRPGPAGVAVSVSKAVVRDAACGCELFLGREADTGGVE